MPARCLAFAVLLLAAAVPSPGRAEEPGTTVLHLAETAERTLPRDRLRAELRAEATGTDAARVQADINRRMAAALERVRAVPSVRAESGGYSVYQEQPKTGPMQWRGAQTLALTGRDFGEVLRLAGDLQGDGLVASALVFTLARETQKSVEDQLTDEALTRLKERAERIAAGLGLAVQRVRDLHVGNADGGRAPGPVPMRAMAAAAPPPVAAEAGDATVRLTIEAEIVLGPAESNRP